MARAGPFAAAVRNRIGSVGQDRVQRGDAVGSRCRAQADDRPAGREARRRPPTPQSARRGRLRGWLRLVVRFWPAAPRWPRPRPSALGRAPRSAAQEPVTVNWWHISVNDPGLSAWQRHADAYMAANPNVKVEITVLENDAFKQRLTTVMQSGDPPDVFQSWGGGVLYEYAAAGLIKDITADLAQDLCRSTVSASSRDRPGHAGRIA